jgi:hypothetical protein
MVYRNTIAGISKRGHFLGTAIDSQRLLYGTIAKGAYVPLAEVQESPLSSRQFSKMQFGNVPFADILCLDMFYPYYQNIS